MIDENSTKNIILTNALRMIGEDGIRGLTVRKLSETANVNIASVNYHFKSKNNLIIQALLHFVEKLKHEILILQDDSLSSEERMKTLMIKYLEMNRNYPGIMRVVMLELSSNSGTSISEAILPDFKRNVEMIINFMKDHIKSDNMEFISMNIMDKMSSLLMPIILDKLFKQIFSVDLDNPEVLDRYINIIMDEKGKK